MTIMKDELDIFRLASRVFPEFARVNLELANERKSQTICAGVAGYPVVESFAWESRDMKFLRRI